MADSYGRSPCPVRRYVERVASHDVQEYPAWDLTKPIPKLPVPELQKTLKQYLNFLKAITNDKQYDQAKEVIEAFGEKGRIGDVLQAKLKEFSDSRENWVYDFWLDDMYLNSRLALPINSNVGMRFPLQTFTEKGDQLRFAARLISGIMDYKTIIDARGLPIDRARHREKGQPMCMEQYYRLFSTYRRPGIVKDIQISGPALEVEDDEHPEHIVVICKNQFFILDVKLNFCRLSADNIYTQLKRICQMADEKEAPQKDIGILTAGQRSMWAEAREKLIQDPINRDNIHLIETCIFILCLDESVPLSFNHHKSDQLTNSNKRDDVSLAMQMLHGHGTKLNSCNRWFDKTMQFIVGEDGACGLNYEHSPSEGIAVVQLIEHLLKYMDEVRLRKLARLQTIQQIPPPSKLNWNFLPEIAPYIEKSKVEMLNLIDSLDFYVLYFEDYGKNFPKSQNVSPDAFIQLAIQLTYYKIYGHLVSTYESASIRRFRLGRVDNIRACTPEALTFCRAITKDEVSQQFNIKTLFHKAIEKQTEILVETILGQGIDNHLLGLRKIAEIHELPQPELFQDESYQLSNHFTLSTSQVPTTMDTFMCYGPVVPDGYGICYNPHPDKLIFGITSFSTCGDTKSDVFGTNLEASFKLMYEVLHDKDNH